MAKKFGKFLLFTAAIGAAAGAVYYYMQKKDSVDASPEDEDYDDFSEDLEDASSRNYVSLNTDAKAAAEEAVQTEDDNTESDATTEADGETAEEAAVADAQTNDTEETAPLTEQAEKEQPHTEVEEFFDEDTEA